MVAHELFPIEEDITWWQYISSKSMQMKPCPHDEVESWAAYSIDQMNMMQPLYVNSNVVEGMQLKELDLSSAYLYIYSNLHHYIGNVRFQTDNYTECTDSRCIVINECTIEAPYFEELREFTTIRRITGLKQGQQPELGKTYKMTITMVECPQYNITALEDLQKVVDFNILKVKSTTYWLSRVPSYQEFAYWRDDFNKKYVSKIMDLMITPERANDFYSWWQSVKGQLSPYFNDLIKKGVVSLLGYMNAHNPRVKGLMSKVFESIMRKAHEKIDTENGRSGFPLGTVAGITVDAWYVQGTSNQELCNAVYEVAIEHGMPEPYKKERHNTLGWAKVKDVIVGKEVRLTDVRIQHINEKPAIVDITNDLQIWNSYNTYGGN